jgi:NAD(P)-dependent dehydrogenase (short-subunit alcohol dehydrogenase family)
LVSADVTKQQDVERVVAAAGARIDILADVAGIMDHHLPVGDLDDQTWERAAGRECDRRHAAVAGGAALRLDAGQRPS